MGWENSMAMKRLFWAFMAVSMLCTFPTGCARPADSVLKMLVGTYSEGNDSKGVYLYDFDTEKLEWKLLDTAAAGNPSFIIPSPDRNFAYAVSEYSDDFLYLCTNKFRETRRNELERTLLYFNIDICLPAF